MLRGQEKGKTLGIALAALFLVGAGAALLGLHGNPGNMGICGACFLRDLGGALGLHKGPGILRPEIVGVLLGATILSFARGTFGGRSGSYAVGRFLLGAAMGVGALVFLGCPFRLLQRLGGGDFNALVGAAGLAAGVGVAVVFEKRGYSIGKTAPAPLAVGLLGPLVAVALIVAYFAGGILAGPGPGEDAAKPDHAPWAISGTVGLLAGAVLSATGFCAISGMRQIFLPGKRMLAAAALLVLGYAAVAASHGKFKAGFEGQPAAHADHLWNFLPMVLVGLAGAFAGGCPVRQVVMAGEGNGDAAVAVGGLVMGGAVAHNLGLVSSAAGPTAGGKLAVGIGIALCLAWGALVRSDPPARP